MALDGSLYDSFTGEAWNRLLRPASLEQALERYPLFVLLLKRGRLTLSFAKPAELPPVVRATVVRSPQRWLMLGTDFEKCKAVADRVDVRLFRTESDDSVLDRIRAHIRVEFSPKSGGEP